MQRDKPKPKNIFTLMICLCVIWNFFLLNILDAQVNYLGEGYLRMIELIMLFLLGLSNYLAGQL